MKFQLALAGVALVGFMLPAAAQTTEYWVVQNPQTRHCKVVTQRPVDKTGTVVGGNGVVYCTRVEAENAIKTTKICTSD
jgi:hypothetical protein